MASDERSDVLVAEVAARDAGIVETNATVSSSRLEAFVDSESAAKEGLLLESTRVGLRDRTNHVNPAGIRKRSSGSILDSSGLRRAKPDQLRSDLRDFFYESKVHKGDGSKKSVDDENDPTEASAESGVESELFTTSADEEEERPSGSEETDDDDEYESEEGSVKPKKKEPEGRYFVGQNEHSNTRSFRRTQSQFVDMAPNARKRPSLDGAEPLLWAEDGATDRKRSCAIVLNDSTVMVEPGEEFDDEVFETAAAAAGDGEEAREERAATASPTPIHLVYGDGGSDDDEFGGACSERAVMMHRANFERTLSASVLERGEFAPPLREHPHLPAVPSVLYTLPTLPPRECQVRSVAFGCIAATTLAAEMQRLGLQRFQETYVLIDCRYPYEYEGGHIKNAINLHDNTGLEGLFFPKEEAQKEGGEGEGDEEEEDQPCSSAMALERDRKKQQEQEEKSTTVPPHKRIPVFYCEYSQKRGPTMAHDLRSLDRRRNMDRYPEVNYDVMYLLERGYRNFFKLFKETNAEFFSLHCNYIEMEHQPKELGKFKQHRKRCRGKNLGNLDAASVVSPTTPGVPAKERRRASIVAREKIRETQGTGGSRCGGREVKTRLHFSTDSEDEKSPTKDKRAGLLETDL